MKKTIAILSLVLITLSVTACGIKKDISELSLTGEFLTLTSSNSDVVGGFETNTGVYWKIVIHSNSGNVLNPYAIQEKFQGQEVKILGSYTIDETGDEFPTMNIREIRVDDSVYAPDDFVKTEEDTTKDKNDAFDDSKLSQEFMNELKKTYGDDVEVTYNFTDESKIITIITHCDYSNMQLFFLNCLTDTVELAAYENVKAMIVFGKNSIMLFKNNNQYYVIKKFSPDDPLHGEIVSAYNSSLFSAFTNIDL